VLEEEMKRRLRVFAAQNFTEFLSNRDGEVVARFGPNIDPMDDANVDAVEALLRGES
jgi:glutathione peroxidase-family protein